MENLKKKIEMVSLLLSLSCPFLVLCCFVLFLLGAYFFLLSLLSFSSCPNFLLWLPFHILKRILYIDVQKHHVLLEPLNSLVSGVANIESPKHVQLRNNQAGASDLCASTSGLVLSGAVPSCCQCSQ